MMPVTLARLSRKTLASGILVFLPSLKTWVSPIVTRTYMPTAKRTALSRNGTRQPQARNCSGEVIAATTVTTAVPASGPR